jgi:prepilin-type N-terminal cleavage/methylation domain-containing protein
MNSSEWGEALAEWNAVCILPMREEKVMKLIKRARNGFTLIELTGAAAIVSVIGVLLPAVQHLFVP